MGAAVVGVHHTGMQLRYAYRSTRGKAATTACLQQLLYEIIPAAGAGHM